MKEQEGGGAGWEESTKCMVWTSIIYLFLLRLSYDKFLWKERSKGRKFHASKIILIHTESKHHWCHYKHKIHASISAGIREYGSTLYIGLSRLPHRANTNRFHCNSLASEHFRPKF